MILVLRMPLASKVSAAAGESPRKHFSGFNNYSKGRNCWRVSNAHSQEHLWTVLPEVEALSVHCEGAGDMGTDVKMKTKR